MKTILALTLVVFMTPAFAQKTINGVTMPATLSSGESTLTLNGAGLRTKVFFKLYVAGLYVTAKSADGNQLANADEPIAIRLQVTSGMVSSDNMSEAIQEGFKKSAGSGLAKLQPKIDNFISVFKKEPITEGNIFELKYVPGKGVETFKNGKLLTTVEGHDFKKALFGIWLGDDPADDDLKEGLLGK